jgi:aryl-alcohol dehydrogenase-like predicted oxidoreductase
VLGELIGQRRDDFVVITKYSGTRQQQPPPGTTGNSRKTMIRSLEASLRRLNTDYVDVFMPNFPDGTTPIEEILTGFDDLIRAGKILHGGLSNFPAWRVAGAVVQADLQGLAPLIGIETEYSLAERSADRELLPMAQAPWPGRRPVLAVGRRPAHRQVPARRAGPVEHSRRRRGGHRAANRRR